MPILGIPPPTQGLGSGLTDQAVIGTGTSVPPGIESILEFNGLYLNDNSLIDTYKITSIGGLEDADLRDDREVNPQAHGETAFDAWYGGRTITLTGYIRAFNIHKLRDMQQAMKQAFGGLSEKPLIFHSWQSPETDCWISCRKGAAIQMNEVQETESWFRRDFMITLRASNPRFYGVAGRQKLFHIGVVDNFAVDSLSSYDRPTGSTPSISSNQLAPADTTRLVLIRNDLAFSMIDQEVVYKYTPSATFTSSQARAALRYIDVDNFITAGFSATGTVAITKRDGGVETNLSLTTGGSTPSRSGSTPYWIRARAVGNVISVEHLTTDPRIDMSGLQQSALAVLAGGDSTKFNGADDYGCGIDTTPGASAWRYDDLSIVPYNINTNIGFVNNRGNFESQPQISISGPITNARLTNSTNGQSLITLGSLSSIQSLVADIGQMTLKDDAGANQFAKLSPYSDWPAISPGDNHLTLYGEGVQPGFAGGNWIVPTVNIVYNDAWM